MIYLFCRVPERSQCYCIKKKIGSNKIIMEVIGRIPSGEVNHTIYHGNKKIFINNTSMPIEVASPYFKEGLLGPTTYSTKRHYKFLSVSNPYKIETSYKSFGGQCVASYTIGDYLCCLIIKLEGKELHIVNPYSLQTITSVIIEKHTFGDINFNDPRQLSKITGVYAYVDRNDNITIAGTDGKIRQYSVNKYGEILKGEKDYKLPDKKFTAILPDFDGNIWFTTRNGIIGVNDNYITLNNQTIEKSFSINSDNVVYVLSNEALYALIYKENRIKILWSFRYNNNSSESAIFKGSGTTPVLLGSKLVVIADSDQPTYNILFISQKTGQLISKFNTPFKLTQCSLVAYDENSVITVNNSGYNTFINIHVNKNLPEPGIARFHVTDGIKWINNYVIPSTALPLYCVPNDLLLLYTLNSNRIWSLTALSGDSGDVIYDIPIGYGPSYDNHWSPILFNDFSHVIIGTLTGLVLIK